MQRSMLGTESVKLQKVTMSIRTSLSPKEVHDIYYRNHYIY